MEKPNESIKILSLFSHPVFLVKDGVIADMNQSAKQLQFSLDTQVSDLIETGKEEYRIFNGGYLSLSLSVLGVRRTAVVSRTEMGDLFHLQEDDDPAELRTMSLIAQRLRQPLSDLMIGADNLFPDSAIQDDPVLKQKAGKMNRSLYQLLREITNLSITILPGNQSLHDVKALFTEIMERVKNMEFTQRCEINYKVSHGDVYCIVDRDLLERALHNMLSNAIKFSPEGCPITAKLETVENRLLLSVQNQYEPGKDPDNLFFRYLRNPGIEDSRYGVGLGLFLIQKIASIHNGCLLMDHPEEDSIRFTVTIPIRKNPPGEVHAPIPNIDYLGGRDHTLVELSDVLPFSTYTDVN